jgi:hypothetical protein
MIRGLYLLSVMRMLKFCIVIVKVIVVKLYTEKPGLISGRVHSLNIYCHPA